MADTLTLRTGRIALIVAAVLLIGVIGWRVLRPAPELASPAITAIREALVEAPDDARLWSALGAAMVDAAPGNRVTPEALEAFRKANTLDRREPRARFFIGVAQAESGERSDAIDTWIALLEDTPPGAPWEATVRGAIDQAAREGNIDVARRLAALRQPRGPTPQQVDAARAMTPAQQQAMIASMVDGLAARLKTQPTDVEGWQMLMRSRAQLGQADLARAALRDGKAANPAAATTLDATAKELGL
jgi:cytochrome c-type biogenesis protein CcmH